MTSLGSGRLWVAHTSWVAVALRQSTALWPDQTPLSRRLDHPKKLLFATRAATAMPAAIVVQAPIFI